MTGLSMFVVGSDGPAWLVPTLLGLAGATLLGRRRLPPASVQAGFITFISLAAALAIMHWWPTSSGAAQDVARVCSAVALLWVIGGRMAPPSPDPARVAAEPVARASITPRSLNLPYIVALLLGVVAAVIQSVVVVMRIIYVAVDQVKGSPSADRGDYGFGVAGLWSLGFVVAACGGAAVGTRDCRIRACLLWSLLALVSWAALLSPAYRSLPSGGYERTGSTLLLLAAWSLVLAAAALVDRRSRPNKGGAAAGECEPPARNVSPGPAPADRDPPGSGLAASVTPMAIGVILLACYHLAVPVPLGRLGFRGGALAVTGATAVAAFACSRLLTRAWSIPLVDAVMGLTTLGLCGLATLAVPAVPTDMAQRYPMVFNAIMVGLAGSTGLWGWLASFWRKKASAPGAAAITKRLSRSARRFAFHSAALALVLGSAMAIWPRMPGIAAMDDSLGRVAAGTAANLFLLVVMLWSSRRLQSPAFHLLTLLTVLSTAGFLMMRIVPFSSSFG